MKKTRKSITKRFKITKNGKVVYRAAGQDHFRAKKSGSAKRKMRTARTLPECVARQIKKAVR
jgi:large subunit ribosomal protein L35